MAHANSIVELTKKHNLVLFMKGQPRKSPCGYSSRLVRILDHIGIEYYALDVLAADNLRSEVKEYSGVKTLPQLFARGQYIGGSDDIRELYERNMLESYFVDLGFNFEGRRQLRKLTIEEVTREEIISCSNASKF